MKTILFVHGGKVDGDSPAGHFLLRLQAAVAYYREYQQAEDVIFLVSGRWTSVTENFLMTEVEIGKQYILQQMPEANIIKEDISVELIGNYAFSKPLITSLQPNNVVIFTSDLLRPRTEVIVSRIIADAFAYTFQFIHDELSANPIMVEREVQVTELFNNVFKDVADGDDTAFRDKLLYATPYYFKGIIDDKSFFDRYATSGFEYYLNSRQVRRDG